MSKVSISTITYAKSFITKTWDNHPQMLEYERRGFFQFLYVTACGHAESVICDYLKSFLYFSLFDIRKLEAFSQRTMEVDGVKHLINTEPEQRAVQRILESTIKDIDKSSFNRIEILHKLIVGSTICETIGPDLYGNLMGLISVRNLLAHGRELYIEIAVDEANEFSVDTSFEKHPLEKAIKSLQKAKLYNSEQYDSNDTDGPKSAIYQVEAMKHFWKTSVEVGKIYRRRADSEKLISMWWTAELEELYP